jgi:hypothetical protein
MMLRMQRSHVILGVLFIAWIATGFDPLRTQYGITIDTWNKLSGLTMEERMAGYDPVAFPVARDVAAGVPERGCVTVLAYISPDMKEYYQRRLPYLLYPRQVWLYTNSRAQRADCEFLTVFRDSRGNLARSPFSGRWDEAELSTRLASFTRVHSGESADVYRVDSTPAR